ncbi:sensor protein EvgS precursor [mine drainage metagenome]|uniref:Sensor protein EvgS n=1 Tax=mine drainage metagenome TaxID=410659 RepID=A0A1J5RGV8_9ZZZZ
MGGELSILGVVLQVCIIDLLLSGDNAVVIALACRSLPRHYVRRAMLMGTGAAVLLRVVLTTLVGILMQITGLKLIGGIALVVIAIKLLVAEEEDEADDLKVPANDLMGAVSVILLADLVMSLDNVVALSAVAQGNMLVLVFGLLLSVPLLMYGSTFVGRLLTDYPQLIPAGAALLGWVAGDVACSDPLVADWIHSQAPALTVTVPALSALFVLLDARIIRRQRKEAPHPRRPRTLPPDFQLGVPDDELIAPAPPALLAPAPVAPAPPAPLAPAPPAPLATASAPGPVAPAPAPAQGLGGLLAGLLQGLGKPKPPAAPAVALEPHRPPPRAVAEAAAAVILLAEDNPGDQAEIRQGLEWLGYVVDCADDGVLALERLDRARHGLLLTDCYMPRLDGFKLTAAVRAAEREGLPPLPVVGMVAHYSTADGMGLRQEQAGMSDCVGKPPALDQLEKAVLRWLPGAAALRDGEEK